MGVYHDLSREQLIGLLEARGYRAKALRLMWERDELEADAAMNDQFAVAELIAGLCDQPPPWRHMVIEGDNFDSLRWLRMTMRQQIKCILIDPPYNTGEKDWIYNDRYTSPDDHYFHSTWLEFLYRRLTIARDLLTEDGVILVCINDAQRAILDLMLNEALPGMRIGSLVWRTRDVTNDRMCNFSDVHEHILIYAKPGFMFKGSQKSGTRYRNPDHDPRGPWIVNTLTCRRDRYERPTLYYPLYDPATDIWYPCDRDRVWAYSQRTMEKNIAEGRVLFPQQQAVVVWGSLAEVHAAIAQGQVPVTPRGKRPLINMDTEPAFWIGRRVGFGRPCLKRFWADLRRQVNPLSSWIARAYEDELDGAATLRGGLSGEGTKEVQSLFGYKAFPYPKPKGLMKQLIAQATGDGDTVLDFFAGSATTAHALIELNRQDGCDRRFIMASSTEANAEAPERNLCRDITAERIRHLNRLSLNRPPGYGPVAFAYMRCFQVSFEDLDDALTPARLWTALETLHQLPLTLWNKAIWQAHKGDGWWLVLVDRVNQEVIGHLHDLAKGGEQLIVYSWAPGQIRTALGPKVDARPVRNELVRRFRI